MTIPYWCIIVNDGDIRGIPFGSQAWQACGNLRNPGFDGTFIELNVFLFGFSANHVSLPEGGYRRSTVCILYVYLHLYICIYGVVYLYIILYLYERIEIGYATFSGETRHFHHFPCGCPWPPNDLPKRGFSHVVVLVEAIYHRIGTI